MELERDALIIGFTGPVYSGSTTIANIIVDSPTNAYVFNFFSLSKILRDKFQDKKGRAPDEKKRSELQDFGNELRKEDKAILVKEILKKVEDEGVSNCIIIDSIRNTNEIYELRKFSNFYLIAVNASFDVRFDRASEKNRDITKQQFKLDDDRDSGVLEPEEGQQVQNCVDLADFIILNNDLIFNKDREIERKDNYDNLIAKLNSFISLLKKPGSRWPSVVELGMNYAYCASTMSRCMQRAVGAAITRPLSNTTREEQIISIGCNNTPNGVKNCREVFGKCYRKILKNGYFKQLKICPCCHEELTIPLTHECGCDETRMKNHYFPYKNLDYCQALHAEENSILQALHSTAQGLEGTTLYTSTFPCLLCAKKIIQIGIKKIYYSEPYPLKESLEMLIKTLGEKNIIPFWGVKSLAFYKLFRQ